MTTGDLGTRGHCRMHIIVTMPSLLLISMVEVKVVSFLHFRLCIYEWDCYILGMIYIVLTLC